MVYQLILRSTLTLDINCFLLNYVLTLLWDKLLFPLEVGLFKHYLALMRMINLLVIQKKTIFTVFTVSFIYLSFTSCNKKLYIYFYKIKCLLILL